MKAFAVTMVYNEKEHLPLWVAYYGEQLGYQNLFIIDHGSDDDSTSNLRGPNIIRVNRGVLDERQRARAVSALHLSLLQFYDVGLYSDCDEFIVPDPMHHESLFTFMQDIKHDLVTGIGLNVLQRLTLDHPLKYNEGVLGQRRSCYFASPLCKTLISRKPTLWSPGFHGCSHPPSFDRDLFIFHLKFADFDRAIRRQRVTRDLEWADQVFSAHHRLPDDWVREEFASKSMLPHATGPEEFAFQGEIQRLSDSYVRQGRFHVPTLSWEGTMLHRIPDRFMGKI